MKRRLRLLIIWIFAVLFLTSCAKKVYNDPQIEQKDDLTVEELGVPTLDHYLYDTNSRNVWDMVIFRDKLYVASGDAVQNTGPCPVYAYDLKANYSETNEQTWVQSGLLNDEQICRFVPLLGSLAIPGYDPCLGVYDWNYGTFYFLQGEKWVVIDSIPNGVHNYDMVEFNNAVYAGLAVQHEHQPVVRSTDGCKTWEELPFYKHGEQLVFEENSLIQVHNLIKYDSQLYAYFLNSNHSDKGSFSLYRYENDSFYYYDTDWANSLYINKEKTPEEIIKATAELNGKLFFVSTSLYSSKQELHSIEAVRLPVSCKVWDLIKQDDMLYVLTSTYSAEGKYRIAVYSSKTGESGTFQEEVSFFYELPARSFEVYHDQFYFGTAAEYDSLDLVTMNRPVLNNEKVGMILRAPKGLHMV